MSVISLISDFAYVSFCTSGGAAIGAFGTPMVMSKFKKAPSEGFEAIPQFILGGIAGAALGATFGVMSVQEANHSNMPETQIIELDGEGLPECEGNRYFVNNEGQVIGCAFE